MTDRAAVVTTADAAHANHTVVRLPGGAGSLTVFDHMAFATLRFSEAEQDCITVMVASSDVERLRDRFRPGHDVERTHGPACSCGWLGG